MSRRSCLSSRNCTRSEAFGSYASSADAIFALHKTPGFGLIAMNLTIYGASGSAFFNEWKTAYQEMNLIIKNTLLNRNILIQVVALTGQVVYSNKYSIEEVQTLPNANTKPEVMSAINNIQGNSDILRFGNIPAGTDDLVLGGFGVASKVIAKKDTNSKIRSISLFDTQSVAHSYLSPSLSPSFLIPRFLFDSLNFYTITASQEIPTT